jgi:transaldolase
MPEATLKALAAHEGFGEALPRNAEAVLAEFAKADIDTDVLATKLLGEGIESFGKSWRDLLACIKSKSEELKAA